MAPGGTVSAMEFAFEPDDLGFIADPYPVYAELRERAPIWYHEPTDHWLVSRYADVNALLRDRRFGRTYHHLATHAEMGRPDEPEWHQPFWHLIRSGILDMEPPGPHPCSRVGLEGLHPTDGGGDARPHRADDRRSGGDGSGLG